MTRDAFLLTLQHIRADSSGVSAKMRAVTEFDRLTAQIAQLTSEREKIYHLVSMALCDHDDTAILVEIATMLEPKP